MNYCGRLWWMLKWCGHDAVAVLDGGLQAWVTAGGAVASGPAAAVKASSFPLRDSLVALKFTADVSAALTAALSSTSEVNKLLPLFEHNSLT
jgi:thiosulfate/3-mercaptopyruvate sulfurtransferase